MVSAHLVYTGIRNAHQLILTLSSLLTLHKIAMEVGDNSLGSCEVGLKLGNHRVSGGYDVACVFDIVVNAGDDVMRISDNGVGIRNILTDASNNAVGIHNILTDVGDDHMRVDCQFGLAAGAQQLSCTDSNTH